MELEYMEHTAAWGGPFESFQPAATNWTAEQGPAGDAQAWGGPAAGHPLEYASIVDIFGSSCSHQPYVVPASSSNSSGGQQKLVEYNYYAGAAQHGGPVGIGKATTQEEDLSLFEEQMETHMNNPGKLFQDREKEIKDDAELIKTKMHRYPPSIQALGDWYTVPNVVAVVPYYHHRDHLQKAEKMKHVAALYCIREYQRVNNNNYSSLIGLTSIQVMYGAVVSAAAKIDACSLYDKDVMAGISYQKDFLPMMFYDACFLVMYMLQKSGTPCEEVLYDFIVSNDNDIAHDITLLENQIPWPVVDAVLRMCTIYHLNTKKLFIANCKDGCLQDRVEPGFPHVHWDQDYEAPHLLGLIRYYVLGKRRRSRCSKELKVSESDLDKIKSIPISAGAIELAEMGIFVTANETDELPADMGLDSKWIIFAKLPMAPLALTDVRASKLINMAALELCMTPDFFDKKKAKREDSAVCSYLLLLSMLMHREEDVHELRRKGILQGAGLTNNKTLDFFTSLQSLRKGRCYTNVMVEIAGYRMNRWGWWLWLYKFVYKNWKIIAGIVSAVSAFASILGTLMKLKGAH